MKISSREIHRQAATQFQTLGRAALCVLTLLLTLQAFGQTPALLWSTNIGATIFAIDANTNVYASSGGIVIKLSGDGVPLQTNSICPRPGLAQRDATGNYYFAGVMPNHSLGLGSPVAIDPQDFGGVVLSNMPIYLAKYSSAGTLLWATNTGETILRGVGVLDFVIGGDGNLMVGYFYSQTSSSKQCELWTVDPDGNSKRDLLMSSGLYFTLSLTPQPPTNTYVIISESDFYNAYLVRVDDTGTVSSLTNWTSFLAAKVVLNSAGDLYYVENGKLTKRSPAMTVLWQANTGTAQRGVGPDQFDGVHLATDTASLSRYDSDGNLAWTRSLPANCSSVSLDSSGNRFLSLSGGLVARLGGETLKMPAITNVLIGKKTFARSNYVFSIGATGFGPLRYYWLQNGVPLPGKTNATLNLTNLSPTQTGNYSVIVSNFVGSVSSAPALLTVKGVGIFLGSQMLTNGTYNFLTPPVLSILSAFTNGSIFYTLDGSAPSFVSTTYTGPFAVPSNAMVRALGYSADFSQSEEADSLNIVLPPQHTLTTTTVGPGSVALNPPGGIYTNSAVVIATATPSVGWTFLYWKGDAYSSGSSTSVTMDQDKSIQAVFGTTLSTTVAGNGQVNPSDGVYPYGSVIRLIAIPQPGSYFGVWGNAASGNANPLYFTLTNPNPTVSSLFAPLAANQAALTVLINGPGTVQVSPSGNAFTTNQAVNITATPLAGQGFINWSGDASGTQNPVSIAMTQSRIVTANFTNWPVLVANQPGLTLQGFQMTVLSGPGLTYQIQGSSNLGTWANLGVVTNTSGATVFTDPSATNRPLRFYRGTSWP